MTGPVHRPTRRRFLAISAAALAARPAAAAAPVRWRGIALGAEASVTLHGDPDAARAALDEVTAILREVEALYSLHDPASALSRLNRDGRLAPVPPDFARLLDLADAAHRATGGRFDPTVQPLWRALAEGGDTARARAALGWDRVARGADAVRLDPGQALTLNGIAQGWATDRVTDALARRGFVRALVDIGEVRALGGPWRVGVEDPDFGPLGTRTLDGTAIATSSPGALRLGAGTHILDPLGGAPLWSTVSVAADRAALADALSTAACLMTAGDIAAARDRLPGVGRILLVDPAGDLRTI